MTAARTHRTAGAAGAAARPRQPRRPVPALRRRSASAGRCGCRAGHLVVFSDYAACDEVLRHPSSASDRLKSTVAQEAIAAGEPPRPFGDAGLPVPRPARPHPASQARAEGVRPQGGQGARTRHRRTGRRTAGRRRARWHLRCDRRPGLPAARRGDLPAARRPDRGRAAVQPGVGAAWRRDSTRSSRSPANAPAEFRRADGGRVCGCAEYLRDLIDERRVVAARGPDLGADRRRGGRRPADRGGDRRDVQPAADRGA